MDSSVFVTVPSGDWVTVFSFVFTVPSLLVVLDLSLDTWRSQPTSKNDNARTLTARPVTMLQFFIAESYATGWALNMG